MENFNEIYQAKIDKYLEYLSSKNKLYTVDGLTYCKGDESPIMLTRAQEYKIPDGLNVEFLAKPHAYSIKLGINIDLNWHDLRIKNINGIDIDCYVCDICNTEFTDNKVWHVPDTNCIVCDGCYKHADQGAYANEKFVDIYSIVNFLDYVQFAAEPDLDSCNCGGSVFYVNCNVMSDKYASIMVTVFDSHGRQRFDVLYKNVVEMLADYNIWYKSTPNVYKLYADIQSYYVSDFILSFEAGDVEHDLLLENETDEDVNKRITKVLNKKYKYYDDQAIKAGIIQPGEILTNRIVLENKDAKNKIADIDKTKQEYVDRITKQRLSAIKQRESNEHYKKTGKFLPGVNSNGVLGCDHYADLTESEIYAQACKEIQEFIESNVFPDYIIRSINTLLLESGVYKHDCFKSFTMWSRIKYDLGFYFSLR